MIKLLIDNSTSQITGISVACYKKLREVLSYNVSAQTSYYSGGFRSNKRYLLGKKGEFPTGLLTKVQKYLRDSSLPHTLVDLRVKPASTPGMFKLRY